MFPPGSRFEPPSDQGAGGGGELTKGESIVPRPTDLLKYVFDFKARRFGRTSWELAGRL